jgi:hypothetical protein
MRILTLLVAFLFLVAPLTVVSAEDAPSKVELRLDQTIVKDGTTIKWVDVKDSRCPTGVQCIWAGEVTVSLEIQHGSGPVEEIKLVLPSGEEGVKAAGKSLKLLSVSPYPGDNGDTIPMELTAIIEVINQQQEPVMCTMDVKECPDGSYVSRKGPDCEFDAC